MYEMIHKRIRNDTSSISQPTPPAAPYTDSDSGSDSSQARPSKREKHWDLFSGLLETTVIPPPGSDPDTALIAGEKGDVGMEEGLEGQDRGLTPAEVIGARLLGQHVFCDAERGV